MHTAPCRRGKDAHNAGRDTVSPAHPARASKPGFELLERAEARFGTKRATLVAGLEALARVEELEREVRASARAETKTDELERRIARLGKELEKATQLSRHKVQLPNPTACLASTASQPSTAA